LACYAAIYSTATATAAYLRARFTPVLACANAAAAVAAGVATGTFWKQSHFFGLSFLVVQKVHCGLQFSR
jgi:uncharacterized protein (DUF2062 family)